MFIRLITIVVFFFKKYYRNFFFFWFKCSRRKLNICDTVYVFFFFFCYLVLNLNIFPPRRLIHSGKFVYTTFFKYVNPSRENDRLSVCDQRVSGQCSYENRNFLTHVVEPSRSRSPWGLKCQQFVSLKVRILKHFTNLLQIFFFFHYKL